VPRARLNTPEGKTTEPKSQALRAYPVTVGKSIRPRAQDH
jgi:hypothetical protein